MTKFSNQRKGNNNKWFDFPFILLIYYSKCLFNNNFNCIHLLPWHVLLQKVWNKSLNYNIWFYLWMCSSLKFLQLIFHADDYLTQIISLLTGRRNPAATEAAGKAECCDGSISSTLHVIKAVILYNPICWSHFITILWIKMYSKYQTCLILF